MREGERETHRGIDREWQRRGGRELLLLYTCCCSAGAYMCVCVEIYLG